MIPGTIAASAVMPRRPETSMKVAHLLIAVLLAPPTAAHGQFIGGAIRQLDTAHAASGIRVVALRGTRDVAHTVTDSSGAFYLGPLEAGVYRLRIGDGTAAPFFSDTIGLAADQFAQRALRMDVTGSRVYHEFEVAKIAVPVPGQRGPRYPAALRDRHLDGQVIAQFVVDTDGRVVDGSFSALAASDSGFVSAVADALRTLAFYPAELPNGRKVRQLVRMPFRFAVQ